MTSKTRTDRKSRSGRVIRVVSAILMLAVSVLMSEGLLHLGAFLSPRVSYWLTPSWQRGAIPDTRLRRRNSPFHPGHDALGYRNPRVPARTELLAIGDSFTYGFGVDADSSWPRQLEDLIGRSVYNAGVGGYGPCEYQAVLDELAHMEPRVVAIGLLVGNDVANAYISAVTEGRFPEYAPNDPDVVASIRQWDATASLEQRLEAARHMKTPPTQASAEPGLQHWTPRRSAIYALVREVAARLRHRPTHAGSGVDPFLEALARPGRLGWMPRHPQRTVFPELEKNALALDLADPRIQHGLHITKQILLDMRRRAAALGAETVVVLTPDKVRAYSVLIEQRERAEVPPALLHLLAREEDLARDLSRFLEANDFRFVDAEGGFRAALGNGASPFQPSDDTHPNEVGYRIIAESVAGLLR